MLDNPDFNVYNKNMLRKECLCTVDYYVKIKENLYFDSGEIVPDSVPKTLVELFGDEFEKMPEKGFRIHRPDVFYKFIEAVGGKRGKCAAYILKHKDPRNILVTRICDVAANAGVSMQTANDTFRILRESDSIRTVIGALMVNPGVDHSGDRAREAYLMKSYQNFERTKHVDIVEEKENNENEREV